MMTMTKTRDRRWTAFVNRDVRADGEFIVAVKTTGVYCKPSCPARRPLRENVEFHADCASAERAGFRACKRCRPKELDATADAIANACRAIATSDQGPDVATLAAAARMSESHFHRTFKSITGVTPREYASAHRGKRVRNELANGKSITSAAMRAGFNSNGRFYESSAKMLGMSPAAFRAGGKGQVIRFALGKSSLGPVLVAATDRGVCFIALGEPNRMLHELKKQFSRAELVGGDRSFAKLIAKVVAFVERPAAGLKLPLDIQGTAFQQRVWKRLCEIPRGSTRTYAQIAKCLVAPRSVRAVARACATNPLSLAIPCHRVVREDGSLAGYRWGLQRKAELLRREKDKTRG